MATTRFEFEQDLETYFEDIFSEYIDPVSRERLKDEDGNELDLPQYFEDEVNNIVYATLPVYNIDIVNLWIDTGMNEPDEGIVGIDNTDIIEQMNGANYEHGYHYVYGLMSEYGFFE